jgi:hypothetical protein
MQTRNGNSILPNTGNGFHEKWAWLKNKFGQEHYKIEFSGQRYFTKIIREHFKDYSMRCLHYFQHEIKYCYIDLPPLYIGKGGTIDQDGRYKAQDIMGRLTNTRKGGSANSVFDGYRRKYGSIRIEYISLPLDCSPTLVEAYLLQAFLNENGKLPPENLEL